jgi:nucleotide-binding universal stress UspA family protein
MNTSSPHSVVAAVDGSAASDLALDWAVDEARRRNLPLHLVHARGVDDWWLMARAPVPPELIEMQDHLLEERVERVQRQAPGVRVSSDSSVGHAAKTLIDLSHDAEVVAMGARGRGPAKQALLGSVSAQVTAHAHCPVVVVRASSSNAPGQPRVVVGVDGSAYCQDAVGYAFEQASSRSVGLTAVHAWEEELVDGLAALAVSKQQHGAMVQERRAMLSEALAGWRSKYPDVDVREHILRAPPTEALLDHARQAELLVVGSRGLGGFSSLLLGSVSRAVLARATCPVAVIRRRAHEE